MIAAAAQLPFLIDYLGLQDDLTSMLLSHAPLGQVNATQERKFLMEADVAMDALWMTPRNGGAGAGIIVEDVRATATRGSSSGPVGDLQLGFVILAERNICLGPAGCGWQPENIEQVIVDLFHMKVISPYGQLRAEGEYSSPAHDWINDQTGIYARRVTLLMLSGRKQSKTADTLSIVCGGGLVTLSSTCPAAGLQLWYTIDGGFPSNDPTVNPSAKFYSEPFIAQPGTKIRAIAYANGVNPSSLIEKTT